jgi:2-polyprenyl-6-methoxyphenol hydroxylase-like FAD-dependent oxidoreductase
MFSEKRKEIITMNTAITQGKKALIIGGGIAGLLAARVLSEHFDDVLIIERDSLPEKPGTRSGTPQSFHLHQVLPRGEMILESFFPGFSEDIQRLGAFQREHAQVQMINPYGSIPFPNVGDGKVVTYSRALLEWALRQRVQALPHVRFLYHQEVIGLVTTTDGTTVTGVHVRERGQLEQQTQLTADLVIEASGRSSKLSQWLSDLGYQLPESERVSGAIGYSTRYYKIPPHKKDVAVILVESDPITGNSTGGVLKAIENDTWVVCLTSIAGEYPPTDARGFDESLTSLISPALAEILQEAEPLTEPRGYRLPECVRHHYEQMEQWPTGLLVLGDAFCHFDPIYGQGMTIAAIEAETLATSLREQQGQRDPGFERCILQQLQDAIYPAWWRNAIEDLRWPGVTHSGAEPLKGVPLLHKYFDLCLKQSTRQLVKLMQKGEFNLLYMNYFLMNWMFIPPRAIVNTSMLNSLLEGETASEKQAILKELFEGCDENIETVLDEIVPHFSFSFGTPSAFPLHEESLAS